MSGFFEALEAELHAATERRPRRTIGIGGAASVVAGTVVIALAVMFTMAVRGGGNDEPAERTGAVKPDPVGTQLRKDATEFESRALVVANGEAPESGPWQIEVSRTKGERDTSGAVMWRRGYCLWINVLNPPDRSLQRGRSGYCGAPRTLGFRKTPGFSRAQTLAQVKPKASREILVWGRVPDRAAAVVITAPDGTRIEVEPEEGPRRFPGQFFAIPIGTGHPGARVNWIDRDGEPGSRGHRLLPPITR